MGFMGTSIRARNRHPIIPWDKGLETTAKMATNIMVTPGTTNSFDSKFAPNTNVDRS